MATSAPSAATTPTSLCKSQVNSLWPPFPTSDPWFSKFIPSSHTMSPMATTRSWPRNTSSSSYPTPTKIKFTDSKMNWMSKHPDAMSRSPTTSTSSTIREATPSCMVWTCSCSTSNQVNTSWCRPSPRNRTKPAKNLRCQINHQPQGSPSRSSPGTDTDRKETELSTWTKSFCIMSRTMLMFTSRKILSFQPRLMSQ